MIKSAIQRKNFVDSIKIKTRDINVTNQVFCFPLNGGGGGGTHHEGFQVNTIYSSNLQYSQGPVVRIFCIDI